MKRKLNQKDIPVRSNEPLVIDAAQSWRRLQDSKAFFHQGVEELFKEQYQHFLEKLMLYERQEFLRAQPYQRIEERTDQANGFYPLSDQFLWHREAESTAKPIRPVPD